MGEEGGGVDDGDMGAEHAVGLRDLEAVVLEQFFVLLERIEAV